jgi:hypothetical protein
LISAHALFALAARRGSVEARLYRRGLDHEMPLVDRLQAEDLAKAWSRRG